MNPDQIAAELMEHEGDIRAIWESTKSAHKRIDENDRIIDGIHKLAANVETLALQVKHLTEKMESSIAHLESGQKSQGERIGALEQKPAKRWEALVAQAITLIVAAIGGAIIAKFI